MAEVTITYSEYEELKKCQKELYALHAGGVDNWEWYFESLRGTGLLDDDDLDD